MKKRKSRRRECASSGSLGAGVGGRRERDRGVGRGG